MKEFTKEEKIDFCNRFIKFSTNSDDDEYICNEFYKWIKNEKQIHCRVEKEEEFMEETFPELYKMIMGVGQELRPVDWKFGRSWGEYKNKVRIEKIQELKNQLENEN